MKQLKAFACVAGGIICVKASLAPKILPSRVLPRGIHVNTTVFIFNFCMQASKIWIIFISNFHSIYSETSYADTLGTVPSVCLRTGISFKQGKCHNDANFGTKLSVRLIEGVRLIRGLLNRGVTVYSIITLVCPVSMRARGFCCSPTLHFFFA